MKIGIDVRLWNETGVGRYIRNLVTELHAIDKENDYVLFARSKDLDLIKSKIKSTKWTLVTADIHWHTLSEQLYFPSLIQKEHVDVMHFPYFSVPVLYKGTYIITIHDL